MPDAPEPSHLTERQKMLAGELYDPLDADLSSARARARDLCQTLNATREADQDERRGRPDLHAHAPVQRRTAADAGVR
jgi:hypothetical protein